ncbi:hypothetical protein ACFQ3Z_20520 [Streptomyces nogalater]
MRGTGSDTVGVDEAYVAEELSFPGRLAADGGPRRGTVRPCRRGR